METLKKSSLEADDEYREYGQPVQVRIRVDRKTYVWKPAVIERTLNRGECYEVRLTERIGTRYDGTIRVPASDIRRGEEHAEATGKAPTGPSGKCSLETIRQMFPRLVLDGATEERLQDICDRFSPEQVRQLHGEIRYLFEYDNVHKVCLYRDWAPFSFRFTVVDTGEQVILSGGLTWHGDPENGYQPAGSVQLEAKYGWSIHT